MHSIEARDERLDGNAEVASAAATICGLSTSSS